MNFKKSFSPSVFTSSQGTKLDYTGGRTKDTIIEWINKKTGPISREVDCDAMQAATADAKLTISYFGASDGDLYNAFMQSARNPSISEKY